MRPRRFSGDSGELERKRYPEGSGMILGLQGKSRGLKIVTSLLRGEV